MLGVLKFSSCLYSSTAYFLPCSRVSVLPKYFDFSEIIRSAFRLKAGNFAHRILQNQSASVTLGVSALSTSQRTLCSPSSSVLHRSCRATSASETLTVRFLSASPYSNSESLPSTMGSYSSLTAIKLSNAPKTSRPRRPHFFHKIATAPMSLQLTDGFLAVTCVFLKARRVLPFANLQGTVYSNPFWSAEF